MPKPVLFHVTAIMLTLLSGIAAWGQQPQDPYSVAESQYMSGDYSKAILTSIDGLSKEPAASDSAAAVELYSILGASYSRLGDFDKAADYMVLCYEYDKNNRLIRSNEVNGDTTKTTKYFFDYNGKVIEDMNGR